MCSISFYNLPEITKTEQAVKGVEAIIGLGNVQLRFIKESHVTKSADIEAKIEAMLVIGIGLSLFNQSILQVDASAGIGVQLKVTLNIADSDNHLIETCDVGQISPDMVKSENNNMRITADGKDIEKLAKQQGGEYDSEINQTVNLRMDTCIELNCYFILKLGISDKSLVGKAAKHFGLSVELEFFNEDNGKFLTIHVDDFNFKEAFKHPFDTKCNKEYVPFDKAKQTTAPEEATEGDTIIDGNSIVLSAMKINIDEGQSYPLKITELPEGYNASDIVFAVDDTDIATVDANGSVAGIKNGNTRLTAETKDGRYKTDCAITVYAAAVSGFTPLAGRFSTEKTFAA